jgi:hypothetical protein
MIRNHTSRKSDNFDNYFDWKNPKAFEALLLDALLEDE